MQKNLWQKLPKPFLVLAPMEDVTDIVFRHMIMRTGRPAVFFTEFTSTDAMFSKGSPYANRRLVFSKDEGPIIAQIWGNNPGNYLKAAKLLVEMGFDGIDINMGCPDRSIVKHGCCGALINNPNLAKEIIQATKEGAGTLPVSVKTRIGFKTIQTETWLTHLLQQDITALTIHGRTVSEQSKVPAHWDEIAKAVKIRNDLNKKTIIIGNGDVQSREEALEKHKIYGVDGIMIGRGIFHNPWLFNQEVNISDIPTNEKLQLLVDHIQLFTDTWGEKKPFEMMKKFYKIYISEIPNAHNFRMELMELKTPEETIAWIKKKIDVIVS
ncbi:MAG TPA: tRNA-dihydrouridine synthase [Candidatus Saccharimonadales bacterium]|nr:tRNA-dihydrouridine synthase [Candidatus Saccharimonadales bacterium]